MHTFSTGGHLNILLSLLLGHDRRIEIEVILTDRIVLVKIAVISLPISINVPEIIVDLLHNNPRGEIIDCRIHDLIEPFDLGFVSNPLGNIMSKRPVTFFSGVIGDVVHRTFVSQYTFIDFRWMMSHKVAAATVYDIFTTFVPSLLRRHICGDIVDFQLTDILTFGNTVIVQETTIGEDNRAIGSGGKDTLFGVVDSVRQRIDVISAMLYVRNILNIPLDVETAVGALFTQISLDTHIEDFPVQSDAIADALHVELPFVHPTPFPETLTVFFYNQFHIFFNGEILHTFLTQNACITQIMENILIRIVRPLSYLGYLLDGPQGEICLFQPSFYIASLRDVAILAKHHAIIRKHEAFEVENFVIQHQLEVLADATLLFEHNLKDGHHPLSCIFR